MRRYPWRPAGAAFPALLALAVLTGCALTGCGTGGSAKPAAATSTAPSPVPAPTGRKCGAGKTAAGVPVLVEVGQGPVGCATAMKIERAYAAALASGRAPGNGGGGPGLPQGLGVRGLRHARDSPDRRYLEVLEGAVGDSRRAGDAQVITVGLGISLSLTRSGLSRQAHSLRPARPSPAPSGSRAGHGSSRPPGVPG